MENTICASVTTSYKPNICLQKPQDIVACPSKLSTRISAGVDDGPYNHSVSDVICLADHF